MHPLFLIQSLNNCPNSFTPHPIGSAFNHFDYKQQQQQQQHQHQHQQHIHSLPSVPLEPPRRYTHNRNSRSVNSMLDFQRLSLAPPAEPAFHTSQQSHHLFHAAGQNSSPPNQYLLPTSMAASQNSRAKLSHSRSLSEYSHPYPQPSRSPQSSPPREYISQRSMGHRRAVSANTVDAMLNPKPYDLAPAPTPTLRPGFPDMIDPLPSSSPNGSHTTNSPPDAYDDVDSEEDSRSSSPPAAASNNRYICPYCSKGFSRPSSLRIHTYSHTGEKPFVCSEDGCGRRFSVQSNMRRHLRVHKLGRQVKKTSSSPSQLSQSQNAISDA